MSRATIGEALMRPAYAAALLGFRSGRALRRYVLERERETGAAILVRVGQGRSRPTYRVSLARLRQHCPELFPELGELARGLRELLERTRRMHELLEDVVANDAAKSKKLDAMRSRLDRLHEAACSGGRRGGLDELRDQVAELDARMGMLAASIRRR